MRTVSWFSCGAASAVATKLALTHGPLTIVYCEVAEEHPDNKRFLKECEQWFGQEIVILGNDDYNRSIYEVFRRSRFLKGPNGAKCTGVLKKQIRKDFEQPGDIQVFGYTVEEQTRIDRFIDANNDVDMWPILVERGLKKTDCLAMIQDAGIELPEMYKKGYKNNNCIGCVKGEAGYWNKIRVDFPDVFMRMSLVEQDIGRTVCKKQTIVNGEVITEFIPLAQLPPDLGDYPNEADIECGIFCYMAKQDYAN